MAGTSPAMTPEASNLRQFVGRWREHFVHAEPPHRKPLCEGIARQRFQHVAVLGDPVTPKIFTHSFTHPIIFGDAPRQRRREMADLAELLHAKLLGLEEGLVDTHGEPGMMLRQDAADAYRMHDREYAGLAKIALLDGRIISEHATDMGRSIKKARRGPCAQHGVDLAFGQHVGEGAVLRNCRIIDVSRQFDLRPLLTAWLFEAAASPFDVARLDVVFVLENAPDPDIRRHLVFRQSDRSALEALRAAYAAIGADIDPAVAEQTRHERWNGDVMRLPARRRHHVTTHRNFADVECVELERAVERLLGLERHRRNVATLDLHAPIEDGARAVIVADRKAQL